MQKNVKSSLLLLTLLFLLVLSISATFAQDIDNSTDDLAVNDNDESISIENQDDLSVSNDRCATESISASNDEEILDAGETTEPMPEVAAGVVSGGVDYKSVNPWQTSGSLTYTVPDGMTGLKSAIVVVNIYSGSGANTYALYSNVTMNTKNGLEVLGYEALFTDINMGNDPNVYVINDHTTKQYSDYQMIYDITGKVNTLNSGDTITINVADSQYPGKQFDGKIKLISLLFAYEDGDEDKFAYWFHAGQLWTLDTASFSFNTKNYAGKTNNMTLRTIALSSSLANAYKINDKDSPYDSSKSGSYYLDLMWENAGAYFDNGSDTSFWFKNTAASYKTNTALLIASEIASEQPLTEAYVDYANGNDDNMGRSPSTAFKTIEHALSLVEDNGVVYINGVNYLDNADVNGLNINKNVALVGLGSGATIDARNAGRIFNIGAYTVTLSNLALINANVASASDKRGGALWVKGATLTVDNCKFINNTAGASSSYGGAINLKSTTATIKDSYFENNSALYTGAGINAESDNVLLNISNSVFTANEILSTGWANGGAICSYGTVIIDRSMFYANIMADGKNGRSINQYGTGSLTITNSILLDGDKSVYVATGPTALENNWWGNNDTNKGTSPKDLGYTNADVSSYLYLNITAFASGMDVGDTANVNINLVSTAGDAFNIMDLPVTLTAVNGALDKDFVTLENGAATAVYTITAVGDNAVTADVLGIKDTYSLSSGDVVSTKVVYVNATGGSDTNPGNSWDKAVKTIEKAVSIVEADGTIYVADGLYVLDDSTPTAGISITKNIAIVGESTNAVISGANSKRIFTIGVGSTLNITKLTLTNGKSSALGGAILLEDGGNTDPIRQGYLIISDSIISNCYSSSNGGAIGTNRGTINNINNVSFIGNHAAAGGVIYLQQKGTVTIGDNNKFINNTADGRGSAIYAQAKLTTGKNNLFIGNVASGRYGYGVISSYGFELGTGNAFINNKAVDGGALYLAGSKYSGSGSYCIFINNTDNNGYTIAKQNKNRPLTLDNCYWGTNTPDFSKICSGSITANNYLVLNITSDVNSLRVGETATVTVDLTKNQNGAAVDVNSLPETLPLVFAVENGNVNPVSTKLIKGIATTTYAPYVMGEGSLTANIYAAGETLSFDVLPELGTVFVNSTGGSDANDGGSWDAAVKTIKHAIEIVGENRTIYLADGVYELDGVDANGIVIDKNMNIIGMGDNVVIDAGHNGRIFKIGAYTVSLANIAFINGNASNASDKRGGALYVNGTTLSIDNCYFINNTVDVKSTYGGAINLKSSTTTITSSIFYGNSAWSTGAGINAENTNVLLNISDSAFINNVILNNGWSAGAAICSYNTVIIDSSLFGANTLTDTSRNGKSINQYGTGSLTITNSILLDGEKGVWVATGPVTLENNWWGNTDDNKDVNPKDLGYTNADVGSYLVLSSSINQDKVYEGDLVTVTTTLENNVVELPISIEANIGTTSPNATFITSSAVSVYNATALGDEVITVNVLGFKNEIRFTVKETLPEVDITQIKTQWGDGIYPAVNNTFTITLNNKESGNISGLVVELYSDETGEMIANYTIDSLPSGTSTIQITDPTIRPITEQTVWPAAQNNKIRFTFNLMRGEDLAYTVSVDKMLAYNGYLNKTYAYGGHDNVINRNYTINGDLIIATQDVSVYMDQYSRFRNETWNIQTPEDAEIVAALLYFNYNWDTSFFPNGWNLTFNEVDILNEYLTHETDRGNLGGWGAYNYGLLVFDVTEYYKVNQENSFIISKTGNCALYPSTLYVLYNVSGSYAIKDVYFSDICDVYYPNYNQWGYDDLLKHVVYYNGLDLENMIDATWYVFAGSSSMYNNLTFNGAVAANPFAGYTANDCRAYAYDVTSLIKNNNEAWFVSGTKSSTTVAYEQVLVVNKNLNKISLTPEYTSVPSAYAGTNNAITVTINVLKPGTFTGKLLADGVVVNETEITLVDGENKFVVIDPTIRPVNESTVNGADNNKVNYTFQLITNDEVVSDASIVLPILYNGYLAKDLAYPAEGMESFLNVTVTGDIVVNVGDVSTYLAGGTMQRTDVWTVSLDDDSTMVKSFVYVPYNWFNNKLYTEDIGMFNVTFNGATVAPVAWYRDQGNLGSYGKYGYGVLVYDVTGLTVNGDNSFVLNKRNATPAVYPSVFIYMYNTTGSDFVKEIYISNGADLIAGTDYNVAGRPVHVDSVIDVDSQYASDATLYVFAASAQAGEGNIVFNGDEYVNVWSGTTKTSDLYTLNITGIVKDSNSISFVGTGSTILALNQIVVLTKYFEDIPITLTPEYTSVPSAYAGTDNAITVKMEVSKAGTFTGRLLADGVVVNETEIALVEGTNTVVVIDPTIRPVNESTANGADNNKVNYTFQLIYNGNVVSDASIVLPILYNGYLGKDLAYPAEGMESFLNVTVTGDIVVNVGDVSTYLAGGTMQRTDVWTVSLDDDSTMVKSFVYVPYNWFNNKLYTEDIGMFNVTFNGVSVSPVAWYRDQGNLGNYGKYGYGVIVYDVTGLVVNGENRFVLNKRNATPAVYPSVFIYMYNTTGSEFVKEIYISNGADLIAGTDYNVAGRPVHSDSVIDVDSKYVLDARLYVFAASAQAGEGNIVFNGDEYVNVWSGTTKTTDLYTLDITGSVEDCNSVSFVGTGSTILSLNQMVVLTKFKEISISLTTEYTNTAYAGTNNAITVRIDDSLSGLFTGRLLADGVVVNETEIILVDSSNKFILIDPTIRPVNESTVYGANNTEVNYTFQLIFNDIVASDASIVVPVLYNGNLGKDLAYPAGGMESFLNVTVTGDIVVDVKDVSTYLGGSDMHRTDVWTVSLGENSTMVKSFVYVPYNWFNPNTAVEDMNMFDVTFNGVTVAPVAWYRDQGNLGKYGKYGYGVLVYDVTGLTVNGDNSFVLNKRNATPAVYPSVFIYMYNTTGSDFIKEIYISNGADLIAGTTSNVANRPVHADSLIDVDSQYIVNADLYVFAASAESGEGNIVFNIDEYVDVWSGTSKTSNLFTLNITDTVKDSNSISFVGTGSTILALNEMVVLTKYVPKIIIENITEPAVGNDLKLVITVPGATGSVEVRVNGIKNVVDLNNGVALFEIPNLNAGNYKVKVSYAGNEYLPYCENTTEFTVAKIKSDLIITTTPATAREDVNVTVTLGNVTADITVYVDGKGETLSLIDGIAKFTIENITAGSHSITAVYMGDVNHEFVVNSTKFNADKINTTIDLDDISVNYGEDISISFVIAQDATGKVFFNFNGTKTFKTLVNGGVNFTLDYSAKGNYTLSAYYEGDDTYSACEKTVNVTINALGAGLKANASDIKIGENATVYVEIDSTATGAVVVILDKEYAVNIVDGKGSVVIADLALGNYTATVKFAGDTKFDADEVSVKFTVSKKEIPADINITMDIPEGTTAPEFSVTLPGDATGNISVTVDGNKTYSAPIVNGSATVKTDELTVGNHTISLAYTGDDNYDGFTTDNKTVDIPKASIPGGEDALNLTSPEGSDSPTYSINLPGATGNLTATVDGKTYSAPLVNGTASVTVPGLTPGDHNITVAYSGDNKFSGISKNTTYHVPVPEIKQNKDVSAIYSAKASYKVLITKDGKAVGAGEKVVITFNGKKTTVKTDKKGYATLKLNTKVKVKKYTITAEYKGVKATNKVTIKHVIKASNKKVKKSKKVTKVKITLKKVNGKYLKNKKVKIKLKGKKYKAKTNKKGVATWKVKKSMVKKLKTNKKYKYTVTYGKDKVVKKLTIKK